MARKKILIQCVHKWHQLDLAVGLSQVISSTILCHKIYIELIIISFHTLSMLSKGDTHFILEYYPCYPASWMILEYYAAILVSFKELNSTFLFVRFSWMKFQTWKYHVWSTVLYTEHRIFYFVNESGKPPRIKSVQFATN